MAATLDAGKCKGGAVNANSRPLKLCTQSYHQNPKNFVNIILFSKIGRDDNGLSAKVPSTPPPNDN